jgi:hypothetical protein
MLNLAAAAKERHDRFVQRIVASREVWGLKNDDGWACTASSADGNEDREVMPFWSDRAYAKQCAKDDWLDYEPTPIPLVLFVSEWLPGMATEGSLVGTNWNAQLCGYEIEPLDLSREIKEAVTNSRK